MDSQENGVPSMKDILIVMSSNLDQKTAAIEKDIAELEALERDLLADRDAIRERIATLQK